MNLFSYEKFVCRSKYADFSTVKNYLLPVDKVRRKIGYTFSALRRDQSVFSADG